MENVKEKSFIQKAKSVLSNLWLKVLKGFDKFSLWMDKGSRTTVIFLFPYVLMFMVFIVYIIIKTNEFRS